MLIICFITFIFPSDTTFPRKILFQYLNSSFFCTVQRVTETATPSI